MEIVVNPAREEWAELTRRNLPGDDAELTASVAAIVDTVAKGGDAAVREFCHRFDGVELTDLRVSDEEIAAAEGKVSAEVKAAIGVAIHNIRCFHKAQLAAPVEVETASGVTCTQRAVPIDTAGLYVPGGRAPLFSTVLMLAVPARVAGCRRVVLCTPQGRDGIAPEILYAAREAGVDAVYRCGGAQAIAAMAYGTESIPRVDKIFGPGNRFVTKAKQIVSQTTAIDMPAGPSEVMIVADSTANAAFVAADMLSQAEHGPDSQAIAVVDSEQLARDVAAEVVRQTALLARGELLDSSLRHSRIIVLPALADMMDFANLYAPEHLILSVDDPANVASMVRNAGSVFLGNYSPESAGDYASGTNHTLPTAGWARSMSGVNTDSFMRKITFQQLTPAGLAALAPTIIAMADAEGLDAHAAAVKIRLDK